MWRVPWSATGLQHRIFSIEDRPVAILRLFGSRGAADAATVLAARSAADPGADPQRAAVADRGEGVGGAGRLGSHAWRQNKTEGARSVRLYSGLW